MVYIVQAVQLHSSVVRAWDRLAMAHTVLSERAC